ncbi:CDP-glycerol:glycerophosphate glycerophosphotransferase [Bacillus salipaludis]|uniref:bifunctional glycosyltransferase/CDP-glycerol:glycerophosphate glycerophosphotransferase n=1 Tax=Bacillus salipaludis TaxID=2547811 RepID=UPI002E1E9BA3|nr:CDP-glycerol:glycerophosphate glycerophosphotransferase [Bacillus salipaludis]
MDIKSDCSNKNIKVSVIIPLYNVENLIKETIQGLLLQTLNEVEFILVDDGSTDDTYQIAFNATRNNSKFRIVRQDNGGPASARNQGLKLANGEFICFVDADDLLSENALEIMYKAAIENNAELVTGGSVRFNSKGKWFIKSHIDKGLMDPGLKNISSNPELFYSIGPCAKLYKRDLVEGIFFPEQIRFGEDQPFVLYAYLNAKRIFTVDSVVYFYRLREGDNKSLTQSIHVNPIEILNYVLDMLSINDKNFQNIQNQNSLKAKYYERVMSYEVWPVVREAIKTKSAKKQVLALNILNNWVNSLEESLFNAVPAIRYFLIRGIIEQSRFLSLRSISSYIKLLETVISKMSKNVVNSYEKNHGQFFKLAKNSVEKNSGLLIFTFAKKKEFQKKFNRKRLGNIFLKRIVYTFSTLMPLNKKKVIFATNKTDILEGNLKSIYNDIFYKYNNWKKCVYLKKERSFIEKCKQYYHLGNAKIILLDDYYNQLYHLKIRKGTEVIQTWHACGAFKKFGFSAQGYRDSNSLYFEKGAHTMYTKVITSSAKIVPHYAEAFNKTEDKVFPLGVPRTDIFFDKEFIEFTKRKYLLKYPELRNKKIILYAPTFRGTARERVKFDLELDLEKMKKSLSEEYILILKLHPSVKEGIQVPNHLSNFVLNLSDIGDVNELLLITDLLITDYSSVIFEYSLLKRPMVFFSYDLEYYLSERGFYYEYKDLVPGPIATTTGEVIKYIKNGYYSEHKMNTFVNHFFDDQDGLSTERFTKTFLFE